MTEVVEVLAPGPWPEHEPSLLRFVIRIRHSFQKMQDGPVCAASVTFAIGQIIGTGPFERQ